MKAATVDDVKPFELPSSELALGIVERQKQSDEAKKMFGTGASALNFQTRKIEEDMALKNQIADEYNQEIKDLVSNAGGDWSRIGKDQIMSIATKKAQDKRTELLINAYNQSNLFEKQMHEIESKDGTPVHFGMDARKDALFNTDGSIREFNTWEIQKKLDHVDEAHKMFDKIGHELADEFSWGYNEFGKLSQEQKDALWYDAITGTNVRTKSNASRIQEVLNNGVESLMKMPAGNQYFRMVRDEKMRLAGMSMDEASAEAKKAVKQLLLMSGKSKIINEKEEKSTMQTIMRPQVSPSSDGNAGSNKGAGNDQPYKPPRAADGVIQMSVKGAVVTPSISWAMDANNTWRLPGEGDVRGLPAEITQSTLNNLTNIPTMAYAFATVPADYNSNVASGDGMQKKGTLFLAGAELIAGDKSVVTDVNNNGVTIAGARGLNNDYWLMKYDNPTTVAKIKNDNLVWTSRDLKAMLKVNNPTMDDKMIDDKLKKLLGGDNVTQTNFFNCQLTGEYDKNGNYQEPAGGAAMQIEIKEEWKELQKYYNNTYLKNQAIIDNPASSEIAVKKAKSDNEEIGLLKTNLNKQIVRAEILRSIMVSEDGNARYTDENGNIVTVDTKTAGNDKLKEMQRVYGIDLSQSALNNVRQVWKDFEASAMEKHRQAENAQGLHEMLVTNLDLSEDAKAILKNQDSGLTTLVNDYEAFKRTHAASILGISPVNAKGALEDPRNTSSNPAIQDHFINNPVDYNKYKTIVSDIRKSMLDGTFDFNALNTATSNPVYQNTNNTKATNYFLKRLYDAGINLTEAFSKSSGYASVDYGGTLNITPGKGIEQDSQGNLRYSPHFGELKAQYDKAVSTSMLTNLQNNKKDPKLLEYFQQKDALANTYNIESVLYGDLGGKDPETLALRNMILGQIPLNLTDNLVPRRVIYDKDGKKMDEALNIDELVNTFWNNLGEEDKKSMGGTKPTFRELISNSGDEKKNAIIRDNFDFAGFTMDRGNIDNQDTPYNAIFRRKIKGANGNLIDEHIELPLKMNSNILAAYGVDNREVVFGKQMVDGLKNSRNLEFTLKSDDSSKTGIKYYILPYDIVHGAKNYKKGTIVKINGGTPDSALIDVKNRDNNDVQFFANNAEVFADAKKIFTAEFREIDNKLNQIKTMEGVIGQRNLMNKSASLQNYRILVGNYGAALVDRLFPNGKTSGISSIDFNAVRAEIIQSKKKFN